MNRRTIVLGVDATGREAWALDYSGFQPSALPEPPFYDLEVGLPTVAPITPAGARPAWLPAGRAGDDPVLVDLDGDLAPAGTEAPERFDARQRPCPRDNDPRRATDGRFSAETDGRDVVVAGPDGTAVTTLTVPGDGRISICVRNGTVAAWAADPSPNPFAGAEADRLLVADLTDPGDRFETTVRAGIADLLPFAPGTVLVRDENRDGSQLLGRR